ncbi:diguanylate cyclase domain-containing protein [Jannaschia sp. R86511]|uniref:diguanylate cyclase domain-containing protein n=1 Tax=Jannaschia sp. R86511 TaxID=3093853 RepID=UPI0036D297AB
MTDGPADPETLLRALVRRPGAAVAAIGGDGFRVPVPPALGLSADSVIPLPEDRATMLDLVLPSEALVVVGAWELARQEGRSSVDVHLRGVPSAALVLDFVVTPEHGMFAVLAPTRADVLGTDGPEAVAAPALRPRTGMVRKAYNAVITDADERALRLLGLPRERLVGVRSSELMHPEDVDRAVAAWMQMLSTQANGRIRVRHVTGDGSWLWVELENTLVTGPDGLEVHTHVTDVSDEMSAHEHVARQGQLFRRLAEALPLGIVRADADGTVDFTNARARELVGPGPVDRLGDVLGTLEGEGGTEVRRLVTRVLGGGEDGEREVLLRQRGTGALLRCRVVTVSLGHGDEATGVVLCLEDVTERSQMAAELERRATNDALTGCLNRAEVMRGLEGSLLVPGGRTTGVVFVDLDRFKLVNDTLGHAVGDALLVEVGQRLRAAVRPGDLVGRLGGDEFLVVVRDVPGQEQVDAVTARVSAALTATLQLAGHEVDLRASCGAVCWRPGEDAAALVARADTAMYAIKRRRSCDDGADVTEDVLDPV